MKILVETKRGCNFFHLLHMCDKCYLLASLESAANFLKLIARLSVCSSTSAVKYCSRARANARPGPLLGLRPEVRLVVEDRFLR